MKTTNTPNEGGLDVCVYDVDQSDACLINTPLGKTVLIDADKQQIVNVCNDMVIDEFITTHIHDDHVAGLRHLNDVGVSIQQAHQPNPIRFELGDDGGVDTNVFKEYIENLAEQGIPQDEVEYLTEGDTILKEDNVSLTVFSPPATDEDLSFTRPSTGHKCGYHTTKANPNGVACQLEGPSTSCLLMGDLENDAAHNAESWLCKQHDAGELDLSADVLFGGHHGSHNATTEAFLDRVDPEAVVISSGLDNNHNPPGNQYNAHPRDETLERLYERDIDVYWTAVHGTVNLSDDGELGITHDTQLETTDAADIAALKYYARDHDLDQEALAEVDEISLDELPEETPEWASEDAIVTDHAAIDPEKLEELHALETERSDLKRKKYRLQETRTQRREQKTALEHEIENDKGVTDRLTAAVGSLWGAEDAGDASMQAETTADHRAEEPASTEEEGHDQSSTDPDTQPSERADSQDSKTEQSDDIDATIAAYEQQTAELNAEITELTEQVEGLTAQVETLEAELTNKGLLERARAVLGSDASDTQPTQIRRARFSETAASLADPDTDDTTAPEENAEPTNGKAMAQTQPIDHTPEQTRSSSQHEEQESSTDRSDDRGLSL